MLDLRAVLLTSLLLLPLALACGDKDGGDDTGGGDGGTGDGGTGDGGDGGTGDGGAGFTDADLDGYAAETGDCDDADADVHPGATEACNGKDDDCDDRTDEGFGDADEDGTADCMDTEECDGLDNDGNGETDEGFGDADDDGLADCMEVEACDGQDNDGDGDVDEGYDLDDDGVTTCEEEPDCDDDDAGRSPLLSEVAGDLVDNDCDLLVDEGAWGYGDLVVTEVLVNPLATGDDAGEWFEVMNLSGRTVYLNGLTIESATGESHAVDSDGLLTLADGGIAVLGINGDPDDNGGVTVDYAYDEVYLLNTTDTLAISAGDVLLDDVGWGGDGATVTSGAALLVDDLYLSADGNDDPDAWCASRTPWGTGTDFGTPGGLNDLCSIIDHDGDGWLIDDGDCDDRADTTWPGAPDTWYDGVDADCEGNSDYDADLDSYDSSLHGGDDCDDRDDEINPGMDEVCDDADTDEDCDGLAEGADPSVVDAEIMYADADMDGYGSTEPSRVCENFEDYGSDSTDCDDEDPEVYPGADDTWYDGVDGDCGGDSDYDADGDGYDSDDYGGEDCDDRRSDISPDEVEVCDPADTDEDCNGVADDDDLGTTDALTYYPDEDEDGWGSDADRFVSCDPLTGWAEEGGDCDDDDATISPDATETWYDDVDQDCDGWNDYDADRDGFDSADYTGEDCDDDDRTVHPYAYEEVDDSIDNDCDGDTDRSDVDAYTSLTLSDDSSSAITLSAVTFPFCGTDYTSLYVISNGRLTFGSSSTSYSYSALGMYGAGFPSIAGWWDDLNPSTSGGTVEWMEFDDAVAVYFRNVAEYSSTTSRQNFTYLLFDDGSFMVEYGGMGSTSGVAGWACGTDTADPGESDLTAEMADLPDGAFGMGSGTETAWYELFATGDSDLEDKTLLYCGQSGTDADGDGWTDNCGDSDDADDTVFPE